MRSTSDMTARLTRAGCERSTCARRLGPRWLAALCKRRHALGGLDRGEQLGDLRLRVREALVDGDTRYRAHQLLRLADGIGTAERYRVDLLLHGGLQAVGRHHAMEDAVAERLVGIEAPAGEEQAHRVVHAGLGQHEDGDDRREAADTHLEESE